MIGRKGRALVTPLVQEGYMVNGKIRFSRLIILALIAVFASVSLESWIISSEDALMTQKREAAVLMMRATGIIKEKRLSLGIGVDPRTDPNETGLIGHEYTDLTTTRGSLIAKRTSTQPLFASVIVDMLAQAGVTKEDKVAVCFSGSFPALNIGVLAAIKTLGAKPVITSSVGASMYGANDPEITWLDMEKILRDTGVLPYCSLAASLGGIVETEGGLDGTGIEKGMATIQRNRITYLDEGEPGALEADIKNRLKIYDRFLEGNKPAAFVNVGGASVALGCCRKALHLGSGLMMRVPISTSPNRGLIFRMAERRVPVIHLLNIKWIASRYGLPLDPCPLPYEPESLDISIRLKKRLWRTTGILVGMILLCMVAEAAGRKNRFSISIVKSFWNRMQRT